MKKNVVLLLVVVVVSVVAAVAVVSLVMSSGDDQPIGNVVTNGSVRTAGTGIKGADGVGKAGSSTVAKTDDENGSSPSDSTATEADNVAEEPKSEEERRAEEIEKLVDAFDAETDRWMNQESKNPPTMKEVDEFVAMFNRLPKDRKDECLHRALNLVSDENVMLLAGILMDKTQDKEFVELVYNDLLNRDEEVKKPILQQIIKDKTHPCWADTAWILDVTGDREEN